MSLRRRRFSCVCSKFSQYLAGAAHDFRLTSPLLMCVGFSGVSVKESYVVFFFLGVVGSGVGVRDPLSLLFLGSGVVDRDRLGVEMS